MATYLEIAALKSDPAFSSRIDVALLVSARAALNTGTADQKAKANQVMTSGISGDTRQRLINRVAVAASVLSAGAAVSDAQIQAVVDNEFPNL